MTRRWWVVPALVVIGWFVLTGVTGGFASKLTEVQENDNAAWLPKSAESTKVDQINEEFEGTDPTIPLVVVWANDDDSPITPDQLAAVTAYAEALPSLTLVEDGSEGGTVSDWSTPESPIGPVPSEDGLAVIVTVNLTQAAAEERIGGLSPLQLITDRVRDTADVAGLTSHATGPGGFLADFFEVFGEIDSTLLFTALIVVAIILIVVYRSPILWILPLLGAMLSISLASALVYALAKADVLTVNGQSQAILFVLVVGAGTDYALLLIARYREELHHHDARIDAMRRAWRQVMPPVLASAVTVSVALMCLAFSDLASNKSLGPVAAIGIMSTLLVMLTFLPAVLVLFGRWVFWPRVPRHDDVDPITTGFWSKVAQQVGRHPMRIFVTTTAGLLVMVAFLPMLDADGLNSNESFTGRPDSVVGLEVLSEHFPAGTSTPTIVIANEAQGDEVLAAVEDTEGVVEAEYFTGDPTGAATEPVVVDGQVRIDATLDAGPDTQEAYATVVALRESVHAIPDADAMVGGAAAINYDVQTASRRDRNVIIPIILVVILIVLMMLLRAIVAPVILIASVVLSFFATMGVCGLVFTHVFHFGGADNAFPLFAFVFLVALGIDYNIFLMTRVREETIQYGTRDGVLRGLTVTGGVITSAGIVLAATFVVLGVLPVVFIAELGFAVAFGVLLDTIIVRSLLVPSASLLIGPPIWWPSKLAKEDPEPARVEDGVPV